MKLLVVAIAAFGISAGQVSAITIDEATYQDLPPGIGNSNTFALDLGTNSFSGSVSIPPDLTSAIPSDDFDYFAVTLTAQQKLSAFSIEVKSPGSLAFYSYYDVNGTNGLFSPLYPVAEYDASKGLNTFGVAQDSQRYLFVTDWTGGEVVDWTVTATVILRDTPQVPVPATLPLLLGGLCVLALGRRRLRAR